MAKKPHPAAKVAAKWWADKLRNPKPPSYYKHSGNMMKMWNAEKAKAGSWNLNGFEEVLAQLIDERLQSNSVCFVYDDHPKGVMVPHILEAALKKAKVPAAFLLPHAQMTIHMSGEVKVYFRDSGKDEKLRKND